MKLLIDDEVFFRQRFGGVSRIFAMLIHHLQHQKNIDLTFRCGYTENEYLLQYYPQLNHFLKNKEFPLKGKLTRFLYGNYSHYKTNQLLQTQSFDLFHPSFYADYYLPHLNHTKLVFTVHDLIHEKTQGNRHYQKMAQMKAANIKKAAALIAVSEHTKKDLLACYPMVDPQKIHVIPLAQSLPAKSVSFHHLPEKFIMYTGERGGYKNFISLLHAFAKIYTNMPDLHLVCCGGRAFQSHEVHQIRELNVSQNVHQFNLTDAQLRYCYEQAQCFVFPSTYEGFGIPMLEAFDAGTPVIAHQGTSLPEVGGEAAVYCNATDSALLADTILNVLNNLSIKNQLVERGKQRAKEFSWEKHFAQTIEVYQGLMQ